MFLQNLRCFQFKNYATLVLPFTKPINFITGLNGAGKTNLLDAIHYLCLTKSAFGHTDALHIQHQKTKMSIKGTFSKWDKTYDIQCIVDYTQGKYFQNNGKRYERLKDHLGLFPLVLTTPYDSEIIQGGSDVRRKFIDTTLCQIDSMYLEKLILYQKLLKQRNSLLRTSGKNYTGWVDKDLIASYDEQLLPLGYAIYQTRKKFMDAFLPLLQMNYQRFVKTAIEKIQVAYLSDLEKADFQQRFFDHLSNDIAAQRTCLGVHKDDFDFLLNGYTIKQFGSQGQQKSCIIALRLTQFDIIAQASNCKPILLLDDIFDKLDEERMEQLLQLMEQGHFGQVWITDAGTKRNTTMLQHLHADKVHFNIAQGQLIAAK